MLKRHVEPDDNSLKMVRMTIKLENTTKVVEIEDVVPEDDDPINLKPPNDDNLKTLYKLLEDREKLMRRLVRLDGHSTLINFKLEKFTLSLLHGD